MGDFEKVIDMCIQTPKITEEILKNALKDFLNNNAEKKGSISYNQLAHRANGKLESIEITDNNIKSFLDISKKYDIDFSLKRDKSTTPVTYHVFFATSQTENFKKAFSEYALSVQNQTSKNTYTIDREQINDNAKRIAQDYKETQKDKVRTKQKVQNEVR